MKDGYFYTFEDKIFKHKLPKGLSYVLQTTDIASALSTEGLSLTYSYDADNPRRPKPTKYSNDINYTHVELLGYIKHEYRWGTPGSIMDYNRHMSIYSVPAKLRRAFRVALTTNVLPILKDLDKHKKFKASVYYRGFNPSNYEPLDRGGLYIELDRYGDKAKVLYRDKEFNLDKEIKECLS